MISSKLACLLLLLSVSYGSSVSSNGKHLREERGLKSAKSDKQASGGDDEGDDGDRDGGDGTYESYGAGYISDAGVYESRSCIVMDLPEYDSCSANCGGCCRVFNDPTCDDDNAILHMPCACSDKTIPASFWTGGSIDIGTNAPDPTESPTAFDRAGDGDGDTGIDVGITDAPVASPTPAPQSQTCSAIVGSFTTNDIIETRPCVNLDGNTAYEQCESSCGGCCRVYNDPYCDEDNEIQHLPCACSARTKPVDEWFPCRS